VICTQADARRLIARYFPGHVVKLTTGCTIIQPPLFEVANGKPMVAVRKLATGPHSAVAIGRMALTGAIDWQWDGAQ